MNAYNSKLLAALMFALMHLLPFTPAKAASLIPLPQIIADQVKAPLLKVGSGKYTKFGFTIYRATLWSPSGLWKPEEPYVLQLRYARSLSKSTLVEAVVEGITEQDIADKETLARWDNQLKTVLPAVEEDDELTGISIPGKDSSLYFNGSLISQIDEQALSNAFFGIWFGQKADVSLRSKLIGESIEKSTVPKSRNHRRKDRGSPFL